MPSLFYEAAFSRRFSVPYLLFEDIGEQSKELRPEDAEAHLEEIIRSSLTKCLGMKNVADDDVVYVVSRLEKLAIESAERQAEAEKQAPSSKKQSFATSFAKWIGELDPHNLCLAIAGYDYDKAYHLYTTVDRDDVTAMSEQWMEKEWEMIKVGYESVVYGFGGGYEDKATMDVDVSSDSHTQGQVISKEVLESVKF